MRELLTRFKKRLAKVTGKRALQVSIVLTAALCCVAIAVAVPAQASVEYKEIVENGIRYEYYENSDGTVTITNMTKPTVEVTDTSIAYYGHNVKNKRSPYRYFGEQTNYISYKNEALTGGVTIPETVGGKIVTALGSSMYDTQINTWAMPFSQGPNNQGFGANTYFEGAMIHGNEYGKQLSFGSYMGVTYMPYGTTWSTSELSASDIFPSTYYPTIQSLAVKATKGTDITKSTVAGLFSANSMSWTSEYDYRTIDTGGGYSDRYICGFTALQCEYGYASEVDANETITKIIIPDTVTTIRSYAFQNCTIPITFEDASSIKTVEANAFLNCTGLTDIELPNCETVGENAFKGCSSLLSVILPKCTSLSAYVFQNCTSLTDVSLSSLTSLNTGIFSGCTALSSISIPRVATIPASYFLNNTVLQTCEITGATSIGASAFSGCTNLSITLPVNHDCAVAASAFNNVKKVVIEDDTHLTYADAPIFNGASVYLLMSGMQTESVLTNVFTSAKCFAIENSSTWENLNNFASRTALQISVTGVEFSGIVMSEMEIPTNQVQVHFRLTDYDQTFTKYLSDLGGSTSPTAFPASGDGQTAYVVYNGKTYTEYPMTINVMASYAEATYELVSERLLKAEDELLEAKQDVLYMENQITLIKQTLGVDSDADLSEIQAQLSALQTELSQTKLTLSEKESQLATLQTKLDEADADYEELLTETDQLRTDLNVANTELTQLRSFATSIKSMLGLAEDATTADVLTAISSMQSQISDQKAALDSIASLAGTGNEAGTTEIINKVNTQKQELESANAKLADIYTKLQEQGYDAADLYGQVNQIQNTVTQHENTIASLRAELNSIKNQLGIDEDSTTAEILAAISALQNEIAVNKATLDSIADIAGATDSTSISGILAGVSAQKASLEQANAELEEIRSQLTEEGFDSSNVLLQVSQIRTSLTEAELKIQELKAEADEIRAQLGLGTGASKSEVLSAIAALQSDLAAQQAKVNAMINEMSSLKSELNLTDTATIDTMLATIQSQWDEIAAKQAELTELSNSLTQAGFSGNLNTVAQQVDAIKADLQTKQDNIAVLNTLLDAIKMSLGLSSGSTGDDILTSIDGLKDQLTQSQDTVNGYVNQMSILVMQLALQGDEANFDGILNGIVALQGAVQTANEETAKQTQALRDEVVSLESTNRSLTYSLSNKETENSGLKAQILTLQNHVSTLECEIAYLQSREEEIISRMSSLATQDELASAAVMLTQIETSMEAVSIDQSKIAEEITASRHAASESVVSVQQEIEYMKQELASIKAGIGSLSEQMNEVAESSDEEDLGKSTDGKEKEISVSESQNENSLASGESDAGIYSGNLISDNNGSTGAEIDLIEYAVIVPDYEPLEEYKAIFTMHKNGNSFKGDYGLKLENAESLYASMLTSKEELDVLSNKYLVSSGDDSERILAEMEIIKDRFFDLSMEYSATLGELNVLATGVSDSTGGSGGTLVIILISAAVALVVGAGIGCAVMYRRRR